MSAVDNTTPSPPSTRRAQIYGWAVFLLVLIVATMLFGPVALIVLSIVAGGALIVAGVRASGWPRPVLIVVGALLVVAPAIVLLDFLTGSWQITVH